VTIVVNRNAALGRRRMPLMTPRRMGGFTPTRVAPPHPRRQPAHPMVYRRLTY
jgi:hypothetical protein